MGTAGKDPTALTQRAVEALLTGLLVSDRQELIRRVESQRLTADSDVRAVGSDWGNGWNAAADELITTIRKMPLPGTYMDNPDLTRLPPPGGIDIIGCEDVTDEGPNEMLQQQYSALEHEVADLRQRIARLEQWTGSNGRSGSGG